MPKLFTYGTLQDESVQLALFNKTLKGSIDSIIGFEKQEITLDGVIYPILVKNNKSTKVIKGTCYDLSDQEILICDEYEGNEYKRIVIELCSGIEAWVYISS
ncbi:gamma-glutamylcyclotransferase family protein [Wenyingzhuangia sp. chi5]|uniref:Gamma-glutamylcyclotransferase family protein n=1 Tax=Wenyingzhuangia gilva TaxID=3057677 RepID=A0ABT8VRY3_9FLAO|nr:gamma-glutamylcyclotransferase family protein [Wenyingzhuangia sp. chi5]MDO3694720.1 gamma-glutamylcyclotransferase family protein [Wenyingzhuangia sp. chi5]